jgi:hypothetical protein
MVRGLCKANRCIGRLMNLPYANQIFMTFW